MWEESFAQSLLEVSAGSLYKINVPLYYEKEYTDPKGPFLGSNRFFCH